MSNVFFAEMRPPCTTDGGGVTGCRGYNQDIPVLGIIVLHLINSIIEFTISSNISDIHGILYGNAATAV